MFTIGVVFFLGVNVIKEVEGILNPDPERCS
jgi:hypothetical protein